MRNKKWGIVDKYVHEWMALGVEEDEEEAD